MCIDSWIVSCKGSLFAGSLALVNYPDEVKIVDRHQSISLSFPLGATWRSWIISAPTNSHKYGTLPTHNIITSKHSVWSNHQPYTSMVVRCCMFKRQWLQPENQMTHGVFQRSTPRHRKRDMDDMEISCRCCSCLFCSWCFLQEHYENREKMTETSGFISVIENHVPMWHLPLFICSINFYSCSHAVIWWFDVVCMMWNMFSQYLAKCVCVCGQVYKDLKHQPFFEP